MRDGIRSNRGRAAAWRSVWTWPLQTKRRAVISGVVAVVVLFAAGRLSIAAAGDSAAPAAASSPASTSSTFSGHAYPVTTTTTPAAGTSSSTTATSTTTTTTTDTIDALGPAAPQPALKVAKGFMTAWARPGLSSAAWVSGLSPYATPELTGQLHTVDPARITAHRLIGAPTVLTVGDGSVDLNWTTDGDTVHLTLVDTGNGGPWKVSAVDKAAQ